MAVINIKGKIFNIDFKSRQLIRADKPKIKIKFRDEQQEDYFRQVARGQGELPF